VWKTVTRSELKDRRNDHEDELLALFSTVVPDGVRVTVVADRGFSDSKLYHLLSEELGFDYRRACFPARLRHSGRRMDPERTHAQPVLRLGIGCCPCRDMARTCHQNVGNG
jgi:hypothetical protein